MIHEPPPVQQEREPREVSMARFHARDRITEAIHCIRNSQLYKEPQAWTSWADAILAEQDTPSLAQQARDAAFQLLCPVRDPQSLHVSAAYMAADAGAFYIRESDQAEAHAKFACILTLITQHGAHSSLEESNENRVRRLPSIA